VVLLFVTLNASFSLAPDQQVQLKNAVLQNTNKEVIAFYQLSPRDANAKPLGLHGVEEGDLSNIGSIKRDIVDAYQMIFDNHKDELNGIVIVTTGPQPVAYLLGMLYKSNLYGGMISFEKVKADYQLVF